MSKKLVYISAIKKHYKIVEKKFAKSFLKIEHWKDAVDHFKV